MTFLLQGAKGDEDFETDRHVLSDDVWNSMSAERVKSDYYAQSGGATGSAVRSVLLDLRSWHSLHGGSHGLANRLLPVH